MKTYVNGGQPFVRLSASNNVDSCERKNDCAFEGTIDRYLHNMQDPDEYNGTTVVTSTDGEDTESQINSSKIYCTWQIGSELRLSRIVTTVVPFFFVGALAWAVYKFRYSHLH